MAQNVAEDRHRQLQAVRTALEGDDPEAAEAIAAQLVRDHPSDPRGIALWARALADAGQIQRGVRLLQLAQAEQHPALSLVLARLQRGAGQLEAARDAFRFGLRHHPEQTACWLELSEVLSQLGDGNGAAEACANAIRSNPGDARGYLELGARLQQGRAWDRARTVYREGLKTLPGSIELRCDLGAALLAAGDPRAAIVELDRALAQSPDHAEARYNLGSALMATGDFDRARRQFERLIDGDPEHVDAWFQWVHTRRLGPADQPRLETLQSVLERSRLADSARARMWFALGKFHDDLDQCGDAAEAFDRGNALRRLERRYSAAADRNRVEALIRAHPEGAPLPASTAHQRDRRLLFIVGLPRSGSTLLDQILGAHSRVFSLGESERLEHSLRLAGGAERLRDAGPDDLERAARAYLAGLPQDPAVFTDKTLSNVFHVGAIKRMFPGARILHVRRDLPAAGWSIYRSDFSSGHDYAYDVHDIAARAAQIQRLTDHWQRLFRVDCRSLRYEDLVERFQPSIMGLLGWLGLDWEPGLLRFHRRDNTVSTASQWQVRQPVYRSALARWQRYRDRLGPLVNTADTVD